MSDRLPSHLLIGALLRRVHDAGGSGMVLARGDADAGDVLLLIGESAEEMAVFERQRAIDGALRLGVIGSAGADAAAMTHYWQRRRARDPDLWVIELIIAGGERLAAETLGCC